MEDQKLVFIIGSTRSGTTWLHRMLAEIPQMAAIPQELSLFSRYLAPLAQAFDREVKAEAHLNQGLPVLVNRHELYTEFRNATSAVYERILARKPHASHILDKRPDYGKHIPLIEELVPASKYIHIIRDGRDVVVSMLNARHNMGGFTADAGRAAKDWSKSVSMARAGGAVVGPERYLEVRYEDLVGNTTSELARILDFIGLSVDGQLIEHIAKEYQSDKKLVSHGDASLNKLRGRPGAIWKDRLSIMQRYSVSQVAGSLLEALGYAQDDNWVCDTWHGPLLYWLVFRERARRSVRSVLTIWNHPLYSKD